MEDLRRHRRVDFRNPVTFRLLRNEEAVLERDSGEPAGCVGVDASESGMRMVTQDFVPLNATMAVSFDVGRDGHVEAEGKVVWVQKVPHAETYHIGLKFFLSKDLEQLKYELLKHEVRETKYK